MNLKVNLERFEPATSGDITRNLESCSIVQLYANAGYDVIAITDHNTLDGVIEAKQYAEEHNLDLKVIAGQEVSYYFADKQLKHIIGLFLSSVILDSSWQYNDLVKPIFDAIHSQNGIGFVAHPCYYKDGVIPFEDSNYYPLVGEDYIDGWSLVSLNSSQRQQLYDLGYFLVFEHDFHRGTINKSYNLLFCHNNTEAGIKDALLSKRLVGVGYWGGIYGTSDALAIYQDYLGCAHTDNQAPEITPISGPDTVYRGDIVEFYVAGHDPDGDYPLSYEWTINGYLVEDATGPTLTFLHSLESWKVGENVVAVRVTDSRGASTEVNKTYTTLNHPPTISGISGDITGYRGTYTWEATGSDAEDDDLTYMWYIDGEKKSESEDRSFTYTFDSGDSIGNHTIRVRIKDEIGDYSDYFTLNFDLQEQPPEYYDLTVAATGFGSTSPSAGVHSYEEGTEVDVSTSVSSGWVFSHWLLDSVNVGSANPYTVTMNASHSLTAVFTQNSPFQMTTFNVVVDQVTYVVEVCSNSSVSEFVFNPNLNSMQFKVDGTSGTTGLCTVTIPHELISEDFSLYRDNTQLTKNIDYTESYSGTHYLFCMSYVHSSHIVEIISTSVIPEFPSWIILPLFLTATLFVIIIKKRLFETTL